MVALLTSSSFRGGTVGFGGIPLDLSRISNHFGHQFRQFLDGQFLAGAGVDGFIAGIVVHQEDAEIGKVIHIQELTQRAAIAPAGHAGKILLLGLVEPANQRRDHMAVGGMVIIIGTVQVGGHHADIVGTVLPVQVFAILQAADLRQGIRFVGLFQGACQQAVFLHGLRRHTRVNAAGTQEFQLLAAILPGGMDDVHFQGHVVVHEIGQRFLIGHNAAHLGRSQKHIFRLFFGKELLHGLLAAEVQFLVGAGDDIVVALPLKFPHNGTAHHAAMAGHINFCILFHHSRLLLSVLCLFAQEII